MSQSWSPTIIVEVTHASIQARAWSSPSPVFGHRVDFLHWLIIVFQSLHGRALMWAPPPSPFGFVAGTHSSGTGVSLRSKSAKASMRSRTLSPLALRWSRTSYPVGLFGSNPSSPHARYHTPFGLSSAQTTFDAVAFIPSYPARTPCGFGLSESYIRWMLLPPTCVFHWGFQTFDPGAAYTSASAYSDRSGLEESTARPSSVFRTPRSISYRAIPSHGPSST